MKRAVTKISSVIGKRFRPDAGTAMLSFALICPVFFVIVGGTIDWAMVFYARQLAFNAAREGARVASTDPSIASDATKLAVRTNVIKPFLPQYQLAQCGSNDSDTVYNKDTDLITIERRRLDANPIDPLQARTGSPLGTDEVMNPYVVEVTIKCTHTLSFLRIVRLSSIATVDQVVLKHMN